MQRMRKNLWFWLYFIIAILLAVYFATRSIMIIMGIGRTSTVQEPIISVDARNYDTTKIKMAMGIAPTTHSYSVNLDAVHERIKKIPEIRDTAVRRMPNGGLMVRAELYHAVAGWTDGTYFYPISGDGKIVDNPSQERTPGTIIFRGPMPNNISDITKAAMGLLAEIDYLEWIENRRWNIHTTDGITVLLPEEDPIAAINSLTTLNEKHKILSKKLKTIDMRDNARILVN